jgi:RNA polymerase sigma-70 factor (ECF subfamily)
MSAAIDARFFRHAHGTLVAKIGRRVGMQHVERVEDGVQQALLAAVETWPRTGRPDNPEAWLYQVAFHRVVDELRGEARRTALLATVPLATATPNEVSATADTDDLLRLVFLCCDDALPVDAQVAVALKVACGFDVREIAERLFLNEATVYKRLNRARARLRESSSDGLTSDAATRRLPSVHTVLYMMFTEGYLSTDGASAVRRELCEEALRLAALVAGHAWGASPTTSALLALMHLQLARFCGRQDASGGLLLLEEQDRSCWDREHIAQGLAWLARSAEGETFSRYHAEAGVAAEHCLAPSFAETRWDRIVACYAQLEAVAPSPLHMLNRALALAEWRGPQAGLFAIAKRAPPSWLVGSYLWAAALSDLHRRCGNGVDAARFREQALAAAPSDQVRAALSRRLG